MNIRALILKSIVQHNVVIGLLIAAILVAVSCVRTATVIVENPGNFV